MTYSSRIFASLAVLLVGKALSAQDLPQPPVATEAAASRQQSLAADAPGLLVRNAIVELESHETITAKVRQQVDLFGQALTGSGVYLQGPWRYRLVRFELTLQAASHPANLLQVCDGNYLWIHQQVLDEPTLGRVDARKVFAAIEERPDLIGSGQMTDPMGLGGLPRLLRSLKTSFRFTEMYEGRLGERPILAVRGEWTPERLAFFTKRKGKTEPDPLPPHLPDQVLICFGRDDLFPYRIEYRRTAPPADADQASPAAPTTQTLATMELHDVKFNEPIDSLQFVYNPGSQPAEDLTDVYLARLAATPGD
jgi:hypothetical protein